MIFVAALIGAGLAVLAFPPFGWWPLIVVGPMVWLAFLRREKGPWKSALSGYLFGLAFYGGLIWWLGSLGLVAVIPLVVVQALYPALFAGLIVRLARTVGVGWWWVVAAGLWGLVEIVRYRFPVGGFEWGAFGYALSDLTAVRAAARWIGTAGWTVLVMAVAAGLASLRWRGEWLVAAVPLALVAMVVAAGVSAQDLPAGVPVRVALVQGSTPCPFEHCVNERFQTYQQHLALTETIAPGSVDLVVWSEGSTGASNADPINNPEVGEAIGAQAARIGSWMLVGSDRPVDEQHWINANVVFSPQGEIVGEYRKRHPVPFGEYIPARPFFDWIPALAQVPRDMIPGSGPVVFDLGDYGLGSVISFEGGFARYIRSEVRVGAGLLVVATNEGSYGTTPASDQFIAMTRMRSAETGLDLVHAAVTGKSVLVTDGGRLGEETGLGTQEVLYGILYARPGYKTIFVRWGNWVMLLAIGAALGVLAARSRVGASRKNEGAV
ncbi:MAG: apolipoprotein N-acyltransferase [Acidimicrobiia bacterium]